VSRLARLLVFGQLDDQTQPLIEQLNERYQVDHPETLEECLLLLREGDYSGACFLGQRKIAGGVLLEAGGILEQVPDGIVLLDTSLQIVWFNERFRQMTDVQTALVGRDFYDTLGTPEILGPDFCPFHTALASGGTAKSTLRVDEQQYCEVHAEPISDDDGGDPELLAVIVCDVSAEMLQRQKLNAIYQAGMELGDLSPQELLEMSVEDRVDLLKSKILHYTQDLLQFETVEIRLVDRSTRHLETLMAVGMQPDAADRELKAEPFGNGVTGFVAATGKSYLCEDIANDPLYLPGAPGARSSLTVPIILHEEILGTFNVESERVAAFTENDLQFLELFSREVAVALNTLELLVVEKMTTATRSTELIMRNVANPVDEILNDAAWILERYIGHEPNVCDRLQRILTHTRDIKQLIQKVGETITPHVTNPPLAPKPLRPKLQNKRILVVDADESVRSAAHELLGRCGCDVETAHNGDEAFLMVRSFHYDAVIVDVRLPDMNGYECFVKLREIHEFLPVILMTGFGYDPDHSIVKARQQGLKSVLYKPFRLDQLLNGVEQAVSSSSDMAGSST